MKTKTATVSIQNYRYTVEVSVNSAGVPTLYVMCDKSGNFGTAWREYKTTATLSRRFSQMKNNPELVHKFFTTAE